MVERVFEAMKEAPLDVLKLTGARKKRFKGVELYFNAGAKNSPETLEALAKIAEWMGRFKGEDLKNSEKKIEGPDFTLELHAKPRNNNTHFTLSVGKSAINNMSEETFGEFKTLLGAAGFKSTGSFPSDVFTSFMKRRKAGQKKG